MLNRSWTSLIGLFAAFIFIGAGCQLFGGGSEIDTRTDGGVWLSSDSGATWAQSNAVPRVDGVGSASGTNVTVLAHDPSDPQAIYMGTQANGLLFSYDGGVSWRQPSDERAQSGLITAVAVDPTDKCRIYIAKGDSVLRTDDCGRTFGNEVLVQGKPGVIVSDLVIDWFTPGHLYAITSDSVVMKSTNNAQTWATVFRGNRPMNDLIISNKDSRVVLVGMDGAGIARTTDAGATWTRIDSYLDEWREARRVLGFAQDNQGEKIVMSSIHGLLVSSDLGETWESLNLLTAPREVTINALGMDPVNTNHLVYTVGPNYYSSPDGGATWTVVRVPTTRTLTNILFHRQNPNLIYLGARTIE